MGRLVRIYLVLLKAAWLRALEYRAQIVLWVLTTILPFVMMAVWLTLVDEAGAIEGWGRTDFISYYVAVVFTRHLTSAWLVWDWDRCIRLGDLSFKLLKPLDPLHQLLGIETFGWKFLVVLVVFPIAALVLAASSLVRYSTHPFHWVAYLVSIVLALLLNIGLDSVVGVLSFWTTQSRNLNGLIVGISTFLSGWVAPLALFPAVFQNVANVLPFRQALALPIEILMGRLTPDAIGFGLLMQVLWIAIAFAVYRMLWQRGLKRYEAVGA
jgi:ABC-2 type transport system permease protein